MTQLKMEHLQEKVLAGSLLTAGAGVAARVIDSFVSWLVAGAGAALALIIGNLSELEPYLSIAVIKSVATILLAAVILTVAEKYLASLVVGAAESSARAAEVGRQAAENGLDLEFEVVFEELEAATLPPMRWLVGRSVGKVKGGDFATSGKNFARCAQWQGLIALAVALLVVLAIGLVACGLGG